MHRRSVHIRMAGEPDAGAVAAIYAPFVEHSFVSFEASPPAPGEMRRRIADTTTRYPWLVCEVDDEVVGYAYAAQHRTRAAYRWSVDTSTYVHPAHHRRGIGRGLYASLLEVLRGQGFVNAYAGIALPNAASVGLHEAIGFTRVGVYERVGFKHGAWHDVGWWQMALQAHAGNPDEPIALPAFLARPGWQQRVRTGERFVRA